MGQGKRFRMKPVGEARGLEGRLSCTVPCVEWAQFEFLKLLIRIKKQEFS